jgi:F-type H+-transporting ATPase subunit a
MDLLDIKVYAVYMVIMSAILLLFGILIVKSAKKIPGRLQNGVEMLMQGLRSTYLGTLGPGGERHLPLIFALFWYILFCNLLELIPFFKSPTANPSNTIGLGLIVFIYSQYVGISSKGPVAYLKHFMGPSIFLALLFIPIEIIGELVKPFSLGMRLFGNIWGEDKMNEMAAMAMGIGPKDHPFFYVPFQVIVYPLQIFTGAIQAYIFSLLACAYIGLMSEHHDGNGDDYDPQTHEESTHEKLTESLGSIAGRVQKH